MEDILKEYQDFEKKAKKFLKEEVRDEEGFLTKFMAKRGIKKEVTKDNSDPAIAKMLIEGLTMGSLEIEKKQKKVIFLWQRIFFNFKREQFKN